MSTTKPQTLAALHLIIVALAASGAVAADEWPQFLGPAGNGISQATGVPVTWSATDNVAWKQAIPGAGWSSPVYSQGKLYLTTAVDEPDGAISLRALCLSADNGHIEWNTELFRPDPEAIQEKHSKNGIASPTPIVEGDRIYVHFGHLGTAALERAGLIVWRQTELAYHPRHGNGGSPVVAGGLLIFSCDGNENPFVAALDRSSGEVRWKTDRNSTAAKLFSFSTPAVIEVEGAEQVICPGSGFVGGYDPQDGREIWRMHYGEGYSVVPRPVFAHGLLFVSSGYDRPTLYAVNPAGAAGDVTKTHVAWKRDKGAPLTPSPIVVGDELYMVSDNGVATCLDAKTGQEHWTKRLGGNFSASPVAAEGRLYFQSEAGVTTVIKAGTKFESLATNDLEVRTLASPVPIDGAVFIRSEASLWRIGK